MNNFKGLSIGFLILFMAGFSLRAEEPKKELRQDERQDERQEARLELSFRNSVDIPIIAIGALGAGAFTLWDKKLASDSCRWCEPNKFDASVRDRLRWSRVGLANKLSHATSYAILPLGGLGFALYQTGKAGAWSSGLKEVAIIIEAALVAFNLSQASQILFDRERPDQHYEKLSNTKKSATANTSFFSGHTTVAFAVASALGTTSSLLKRESAPWVWGVGMSLASTSGYLRIAADRHYLSDVLVGAAVGGLSGFMIPYFMHSPKKSESALSRLQILPLAHGFAARLDW